LCVDVLCIDKFRARRTKGPGILLFSFVFWTHSLDAIILGAGPRNCSWELSIWPGYFKWILACTFFSRLIGRCKDLHTVSSDESSRNLQICCCLKCQLGISFPVGCRKMKKKSILYATEKSCPGKPGAVLKLHYCIICILIIINIIYKYYTMYIMYNKY